MATTKRYQFFDRKVSDLTKFSATNPRYWVIDTTTNLPVDEFVSAAAARATARDMNVQAF